MVPAFVGVLIHQQISDMNSNLYKNFGNADKKEILSPPV
jgi:hypothetical protein